MTEEKIEQTVTISGQATAGNITLIGKIVKRSAEWQDSVFNFFSNHRYFFILACVFQIGLLALYWSFKDLYQIRWWLWALTAVLLLAGGWLWYTYWRFGHVAVRLIIGLACVLAFFSIVGNQAWIITHPVSFAPQLFGIAVAQLKDSGLPVFSNRTSELSEQIYDRLCLDIERTFPGDAKNCTRPVGSRDIAVRSIGIIPDSETATSHGQDIGAEIVIWGRLLKENDGSVTLRFEVLETLDQAVNPDFPVVMPVTATSTEIFASTSEQNISDDPVEIKESVAQQSIIISSFILGLAAYLDQNFPLAIQQLETTIDTIEENPDLTISDKGMSMLYYYLGKANHTLGRIPEGQAWLEQARLLNSEEPAIFMSLALGHGSLGHTEERDENLNLTIIHLNNWLETHPDDIRALYDRGLTRQIQNQNETAVFDYEHLLELDPTFYIAYLQISVALSELGRTEEAVDWLEKAIDFAEESETNTSWAYLRLGVVYQKANQPDQAKAAYQKAIELDPKVDQMYFFYARFLEQQQEMDAALNNYLQMVNVTFKKGWAYTELGHFYRQRGLHNKALEAYQRALNEENNNPLLLAYLAQTYFDLGQQNMALQTFTEAIEADQNIGTYFVYATYGSILQQSGDYSQAAMMYEKSLELRSIDYPVLMNLSITYEVLGDTSKAIETYQKIIDLENIFSKDKIQTARERLEAIETNSP
ncbi:MAG: tetratricopeptide repeat protein [Chloroflexi bacterium]|nr:tetratricopeptide repeat protein [Chloroflexota bacterium]